MDNRMSGISTKVGASAAGGAAATILWALLALVWGAVRDMDPQALAALTGATATLLAFGLGYLVPETAIIDTATGITPPPDEVITDHITTDPEAMTTVKSEPGLSVASEVATLQGFQAYHQSKGWADIGYNFRTYL